MVELKLDGVPLQAKLEHPLAVRARKVLDTAADDELFTLQTLAEKIGVTAHHLTQERLPVLLPDYCYTPPKRSRYWGSRNAIAELRRQLPS